MVPRPVSNATARSLTTVAWIDFASTAATALQRDNAPARIQTNRFTTMRMPKMCSSTAEKSSRMRGGAA
jgi:hypothetical protein